jgi:two-component system phosphate regulon sensor histidine kinase PhoR
MLPAKNFSPQQVAGITSFPVGLLGGIATYAYGESLLHAFVVFIALIIVSYISVFVMLQRFIYRKIKLIYKLIYQTKASKREEFYYKNILPPKSIEEVSVDVEQWAIQHKEVIEILK